MEYLAKHNAVQHAPAILESFKEERRIYSGNCVKSLGDLHYEQALEVILKHLPDIKHFNTIAGIFEYLGNIRNEICRDVLRDAVTQSKNSLMLGLAMEALLQHYDLEDTSLILDKVFNMEDKNGDIEWILGHISNSFEGFEFFRNLNSLRKKSSKKNYNQIKDNISVSYPFIEMDDTFTANLFRTIEKRNY
ncbi:hypothetical protein KKB18_04290, partial [bacterium]|nr:hypothetical protein [bacterium]